MIPGEIDIDGFFIVHPNGIEITPNYQRHGFEFALADFGLISTPLGES